MKATAVKQFYQTLLRAPAQALLAVVLLCAAPAALAQEFVWAPDFPVGAAIPAISAQDQDGNVKTFADLVGEKGMLFMMSRSFDW